MKLEYEQFKDRVITMLGEKLGDGRMVGTGTVTKLNGQKLDSIYIAREGQEIYPTCYLNHYYDIYEDGMTLETIVSMIMEMGTAAPGPEEQVYMKLIDYEKAKDLICLRVVNTERNRELLENIPSIPFLDLSVVFYVLFCRGNSSYQSTVSNDLLKTWGVEKKDLIKTSCENTKRLNPLYVAELREMLEKFVPWEADEDGPVPDVAVISSQSGSCGAVYMLDMGLLAEYAQRYDDDLLIIPSSIHEVLVLPASKGDRGELDRTVRSVNDTALAAGDYLSDHTYLYLREQGRLTM